MATASSRATFLDICMRRLGDPVIEINIDPDQQEDCIDESIQYWQEYHNDAVQRIYKSHLVTADDVSNGYISLGDTTILYVTRMFPVASSFNTSFNFFDIKYQMMLNDIADLQNFAGDLAYYEQMQQYLSLLDQKLNGHPQTTYVRHGNRVYIHGDFEDKDVKAGEYIIFECYQTVNMATFTATWNDMWLKDYATAVLKRQWGSNLIKFEGMVLPGGVTLNGRQIFDDAREDITRLKEEIRLTFETPVDFFIG